MRYLVKYLFWKNLCCILNPEEDFDRNSIANSHPLEKFKHEWNVSSDITSDTSLKNSYQQLIPILQTHFDYYSTEDPVSVDSFTSSDDDSASTVILLKSSEVEVNVDEPDSHDPNLPSLSQQKLQALPEYDYLLFHEKEDVIKPKYGKWDGAVKPTKNQPVATENCVQYSEYFDKDFDKTCELNFSQNKRETTQSINVDNESEKIDVSHESHDNTNTSYSTLNKGNLGTAMIFI